MNSVRLPWNSVRMLSLALTWNLTLAFTVFLHVHCEKQNIVSQHCTFMQMTSSIFLIHAVAWPLWKPTQLHLALLFWAESHRNRALHSKTVWLSPQNKKCTQLHRYDLPHILGCDSLCNVGKSARLCDLYKTIPARIRLWKLYLKKQSVKILRNFLLAHLLNSPIS